MTYSSYGIYFYEKFHSDHVKKGVWSLSMVFFSNMSMNYKCINCFIVNFFMFYILQSYNTLTEFPKS